MTSIAPPSAPSSSGRTAVVLTERWSARDEDGWFVRQVAGALACAGDVHVVTTEGAVPRRHTDSVFTVHELARPAGAGERLRNGLLVEAFAAQGQGVPGSIATSLAARASSHWDGADRAVAAIAPDLVVVAGPGGAAGLQVVGGAAGDAPVTLVPLLHDGAPVDPGRYGAGPVLDRVASVVTATPGERDTARLLPIDQGTCIDVGVPLRADPNARREPNTYIGSDDYVLVLAGVTSDAADLRADLARLVRLAFPGRPVGIVATNAFEVWHHGRSTVGWAIERSGDLLRLMAWAAVVVDLRPGPLVARRAIESLLHGTPVVVPEQSAARQHAAAGGGLWFATPQELLSCLDALEDPGVRAALGDQGNEAATRHYGSPEAFVERVLGAVGWGT
ncbi:MAG: glycosyltransferase [Acidimicrobiales bacterium]